MQNYQVFPHPALRRKNEEEIVSIVVDAATSITSGIGAAKIGVYSYVNQNAQKRGAKKDGTERVVNNPTHFAPSRASIHESIPKY